MRVVPTAALMAEMKGDAKVDLTVA